MHKIKNHKKTYANYIDFQKASVHMQKYQKIHNIIRMDYEALLNITEKHRDDKVKFDTLYRACIKSFFSLIEADLFGLNNIDKYENYSDKDRFEIKFKRTFKQICKTWNRMELQKQYFDEKYRELSSFKKKRDELIHPKEEGHIHEASEFELEKLKKVFYDYDLFINDIMTGFFINIDLNIKSFLDLSKDTSK